MILIYIVLGIFFIWIFAGVIAALMGVQPPRYINEVHMKMQEEAAPPNGNDMEYSQCFNTPSLNEREVYNCLIYSLNYFYYLFQGKSDAGIISLVMSDLFIVLPYFKEKFGITPLASGQNIHQVISCNDKLHELSVKSATVFFTFWPIILKMTENNFELNDADRAEIKLFMEHAGQVCLVYTHLARLKKVPEMVLPNTIQNAINVFKQYDK